MKPNLLVIASAVALSVAIPAQAAGEGGYLVGSVGSTKLKLDKSSIDSDLASAGVTNISSSLDDKDTGYKLALGYQYNPNFALEVGYVDLGKAKYTATGTASGSPISANADFQADGWTIAAVGILPINNAFSLLGKIGTIDATVKANASATAGTNFAAASAKATKWKGFYGVGASYQFTNAIGLRAEYVVYSKLGDDNIGKSDVNMLSLGVVIKF